MSSPHFLLQISCEEYQCHSHSKASRNSCPRTPRSSQPLRNFFLTPYYIMKTSTFLLFITYLTPTLATLQYYLARTLPDSQCTTHIVPSKNTCCSCNQSNCPESFGQACGDDVSGNVCPGKQILRVADDSPGAFAGSTLINTALCGAKGLCYEQKWL